jgi:thiol-disulfide isomerase/thioredoxin
MAVMLPEVDVSGSAGGGGVRPTAPQADCDTIEGMKRRRLLALLTVVCATVAGCTGASRGSHGDFQFRSATTLGQLIPIADRKPAETVTGSGVSGGAVKVTGRAGHVEVINFWATWCAPCAAETPRFQKIYLAYRAKGVDFVGVDTKDTSHARTRSFLKDNQITYPMVYDEEGRAALALGDVPTSGLPFTILIDRTGRVAAVYVDVTSTPELTGALNRLLAEPSTG